MSLTIASVAAELEDLPLSANKTDMATIVKVMQLPDSGLEIRDRMWLKITIANAVIGEKQPRFTQKEILKLISLELITFSLIALF